MKTTITICLLLFTFTSFSQNFVCHGGTVKSVNDSALPGHLNHGDTLLDNVSDENIGEDCNLLSMPSFDLKSDYPEGLSYSLFSIDGKLLKKGKTYPNMVEVMPKSEILILDVKGYKRAKIIL